jgi:hypothetical protein
LIFANALAFLPFIFNARLLKYLSTAGIILTGNGFSRIKFKAWTMRETELVALGDEP